MTLRASLYAYRDAGALEKRIATFDTWASEPVFGVLIEAPRRKTGLEGTSVFGPCRECCQNLKAQVHNPASSVLRRRTDRRDCVALRFLNTRMALA